MRALIDASKKAFSCEANEVSFHRSSLALSHVLKVILTCVCVSARGGERNSCDVTGFRSFLAVKKQDRKQLARICALMQREGQGKQRHVRLSLVVAHVVKLEIVGCHFLSPSNQPQIRTPSPMHSRNTYFRVSIPHKFKCLNKNLIESSIPAF